MRLIAILIAIFTYLPAWGAVKETHPRLYLTDARMTTMQAAATANTVQWQRLMAFADGAYYSPEKQHIFNRALVYKIKQANGDADANVYRDAAITRTMALVEHGTSTGVDANKLTDSAKNWIDESSVYQWDLLGIKRYYGINPDITQNKFFRINLGYGADPAYPGYRSSGHTDTEYYIHPNPSTYLQQYMFSPRTDFATASTTGDTYVIFPANPENTKDRVLGMAVAFDWLYDDLSIEQKDLLVAWFRGAATYMMTEINYGMQTYGWTNYTLDYLSDLSAIGYAVYGYDTDFANTLLSYVSDKYNGGVKDNLVWTLQKGGWLEGDGYGAAILDRLTEFLDHGYTAEGLDRWADFSEVLKDRLLYAMHMTLPPIKTGTGSVPYREIIANGDGGRAWETAYDYMRKFCLMIIARYPDEAVSKIAQTFFSNTTDRNIFPLSSGWEFMFYNPDQATLPVTDAPLQNAAINVGMVQMRSSWGSDATQATFKCGPKLAYHSHLDATAFTIFKTKDLAPDTGTYPGAGGGLHSVNYFVRTIAHNALLLHDPTERSWVGAFQGGTAVSNDGGQRNILTFNADGTIKRTGSWQTTGYNSGSYKYLGNEDIYKMGSITKYDSGSNFVYAVGDATSGYDGSTHKAQQVIRKFFYLRPDFFVVYDKVKTKDTSITPKFVLHSVDTMAVNGTPTTVAADAEYHYADGNMLTLDNGTGRLFSKTLIPAAPVIKKIGGRGLRDFWVDGINYPAAPEYGLWRAEIETPTPSLYTEFLTTLYATSTSTASMPDSETIDSSDGEMRGVLSLDTIVLFSKSAIDTIIDGSVTYTADATTHIITDLGVGVSVDVTRAGTPVSGSPFITSAAGTLEFSATTGSAEYVIAAGEATCASDPALCPTDDSGVDCVAAGWNWCTTVCQAAACPTPSTCSDGLQNGLEDGVDCGTGCPVSCVDPAIPGILRQAAFMIGGSGPAVMAPEN